MTNEFYELEKNNAVDLIALSIIRELFENNLISKSEYSYVLDKLSTT